MGVLWWWWVAPWDSGRLRVCFLGKLIVLKAFLLAHCNVRNYNFCALVSIVWRCHLRHFNTSQPLQIWRHCLGWASRHQQINALQWHGRKVGRNFCNWCNHPNMFRSDSFIITIEKIVRAFHQRNVACPCIAIVHSIVTRSRLLLYICLYDVWRVWSRRLWGHCCV